MRSYHLRAARLTAVAVLLIYGLLSFSKAAGVSSQAVEDKYEGDSCVSLSALPGTCTVPNDCSWIQLNVIQKRLFSIHNIPRCGFKRNDILICCPDENTPRKAVQACENLSRGSSRITQHIIDGKEVDEGEIPFIVALGYSSTESGKEYDFRCGASWIAKSFLLTAAHCVRTNDLPVIARAGTVDLSNTRNPSIYQESKLKMFHRHPEYKPRSKYHDIALIELVTPFEYDENVNRICLHTDTRDMAPDHVLTASGWGLTNTDGTRSNILLKVYLKTEPLDQCAEHYRNQVGTFGGRLASGLSKRQYCAIGNLEISGNRGDTCGGDSGGPLHYNNETADRFYLVGITSFGLGCGASAGIYTRVAAYLDWIESIVWPNETSLLD